MSIHMPDMPIEVSRPTIRITFWEKNLLLNKSLKGNYYGLLLNRQNNNVNNVNINKANKK